MFSSLAALVRVTFTSRNIRSNLMIRSARADLRNVKFPNPKNVGTIETKSMMPKKLSEYRHLGLETLSRAMYSREKKNTATHSMIRNV